MSAICFGFHAPTPIWGLLIGVGVFVVIWTGFWRTNRNTKSVYFDAQDFAHYEGGAGRELPVSAAEGTFEPLLQHYIGVTKVLITLAAASITFGQTQSTKSGILLAKIVLAFSILYGVMFCAFVLYMYDEYTQNVRAYTRFWYSMVETLGFSALFSFVVGYAIWVFNLG